MNSHIEFLRRVRICGEECGAVARALHHEAEIEISASRNWEGLNYDYGKEKNV